VSGLFGLADLDAGGEDLADPEQLLGEVEALIELVDSGARRQTALWADWDIRPDFRPSAENLAAYLALRHHDLRAMQRSLMALGLSSLGRAESRVMATLEAVRAALAALAGEPWRPAVQQEAFFAGETLLAQRMRALFGPPGEQRQVALLVTCPSEAADDPAFFQDLARRGVEAVRINCAHDDQDAWARMIHHVRTIEGETGRRIRVFMDLAGPKLRTGEICQIGERDRLLPGDRIALVLPGGLGGALPADIVFAAECTLPEAIAAVRPGQRLLINDGAIWTQVEETCPGRVVVRVTRCKAEGARFRKSKGINLPDTELHTPALTDKDRADLAFVAANADGIAYSFVQSAQDVALLQEALAVARPDDWRKIALILKIETARAVSNLPAIVVRAAARQPVAVMIARGDLAIEIGFARLAEMQEEILWIGEAAQVPVIWATQVLEQFVKTGLPNRGELTDAAMAVRAECVMLNKGDYLMEAIDALDTLLGRMEGHVRKKTPQLRRLLSW
jgi:pyruvate kinase